MRDPRQNQKEYDALIDSIKVCGANRGPHDYIPIQKLVTDTAEHVTMMMCRVCFSRIPIQKIFEYFPEIRNL